MEETVNQEATETTERVFKQAELDQIVGERLARERTKYADYDVLKAKAARLDELEESQKSELEKATERATAAESELQTLKRAQEIRDIREKVSRETGVPVSLLVGETEDECKALADGIKSFASPGYPTVKDHGEMKVKTSASTRDVFAAWAQEALN